MNRAIDCFAGSSINASMQSAETPGASSPAIGDGVVVVTIRFRRRVAYRRGGVSDGVELA